MENITDLTYTKMLLSISQSSIRSEMANSDRLREEIKKLENNDQLDEALILEARKWLLGKEINVLNVAGNRESTSPGIGDSTILILEKLFGMHG